MPKCIKISKSKSSIINTILHIFLVSENLHILQNLVVNIFVGIWQNPCCHYRSQPLLLHIFSFPTGEETLIFTYIYQLTLCLLDYIHTYIRIYIYRETRWVFVIGFLTWPTSSKTTPMSSSTTLWFEIHMNEYYETGTISGREIKTVLCHRGFYTFIQKILINFKCCWGPFL